MSICDKNTKFKGLKNISEDLLLNIVESNFKLFFDWAFLEIGAWFDTTIPNSGTIYSNTINPPYKLILVEDPSYDDGAVWQGIRKDWVWESGLCHTGIAPIDISGVYLDSVFLPYASGDFIINYPQGKIIFNEAINTDTNVELNHSYRFVQTYRASDSPWFNLIQYSSFQNDSLDIKQTANGEWSIGGEHRIQLPAIVIESVPRSRSKPYEIGSNSLVMEQDVAFYVLAENKNDRNKILDILRLQQDLVIWLFDTNKISQDDNYPLNYNGDKKNNAIMYPDIVDQYPWRKCWIKNVGLFEIETTTPNLYQGLARATVEIISD